MLHLQALNMSNGKHHKDLLGQPFGELKVIKRLPSKPFGRARKLISMWRLCCIHRHIEDRSAASLAVTGDGTKCKQCRHERTL